MDSNKNVNSHDVPLFLDFAVEVPDGIEIEQNAANDCVTWGVGGCDDD